MTTVGRKTLVRSTTSTHKAAQLEGWLQKKGDKGLYRSYKRRFFQQKGHLLHYYAAKNDPSPLGSINLRAVSGARITSCPTERKKDATCNFEISTPTRLYDLIAPTDIEANYWVTGITEFIERSKKAINSNTSAPMSMHMHEDARSKRRTSTEAGALSMPAELPGRRQSTGLRSIDVTQSAMSLMPVMDQEREEEEPEDENEDVKEDKTPKGFQMNPEIDEKRGETTAGERNEPSGDQEAEEMLRLSGNVVEVEDIKETTQSESENMKKREVEANVKNEDNDNAAEKSEDLLGQIRELRARNAEKEAALRETKKRLEEATEALKRRTQEEEKEKEKENEKEKEKEKELQERWETKLREREEYYLRLLEEEKNRGVGVDEQSKVEVSEEEKEKTRNKEREKERECRDKEMSAKIDAKRKKIHKLRTRWKDKETETHQTHETRLRDLTLKLQRSEKKAAKKARKTEVRRRAAERLDTRVREAETRAEELQKGALQLEEINSALYRDIDDKEKAMDGMSEVVSELRKKAKLDADWAAEAEVGRRADRTAIVALETRLVDTSKELDRLNVLLAEAAETKRAQDERSNKNVEEVLQLKFSLTSLQQELSVKNNELEDTQSRLREADARIDSITTAKMEADRDLTEATQTIQNLRAAEIAIAESTIGVPASSEEIEHLRSQLLANEASFDALSGDFDSLTRKHNALEREMEKRREQEQQEKEQEQEKKEEREVGMTAELQKQLSETRGEMAHLERELFFSMAVGIKLNLSLRGRSSNRNIMTLYETATAAALPKSQWNVWLHQQLDD